MTSKAKKPAKRKTRAKKPTGDLAPHLLARRLLAWYDRHRRILPWRATGPGYPAPYRVWLAEIMLQQTTVAAVGPYFERFTRRWPNIEALATAALDDVLTAWAGLGYYARARNLHKCARHVVENLDGMFPETEATLLELPGIGPYTAAAIAAIAFDRKATILDGNVERVIARLYRVGTRLPKAKGELLALAARLTPAHRPGDYAQAIMDLGATICTPTRPRCVSCPWQTDCAARKKDDMEDFPRKAPKAKRPQRFGICFVMLDAKGQIALERRPDKGLLGGMMQVPTSDWRAKPWPAAECLSMAPVDARWRMLDGKVAHVFTHFELELRVMVAKAPKISRYRLVEIEKLSEVALPSVMQKVVKLALASL